MLEKIFGIEREKKPTTILECKTCKHMIRPYDNTPYYPPMSIRTLYYQTYTIKSIDECSACSMGEKNRRELV